MDTQCELTTPGEPNCDRPAVVLIGDRTCSSLRGCDRHGVRALLTIPGSLVWPLPGRPGEAIAVYLTARGEGRP
jgi:hypothetical protein